MNLLAAKVRALEPRAVKQFIKASRGVERAKAAQRLGMSLSVYYRTLRVLSAKGITV